MATYRAGRTIIKRSLAKPHRRASSQRRIRPSRPRASRPRDNEPLRELIYLPSSIKNLDSPTWTAEATPDGSLETSSASNVAAASPTAQHEEECHNAPSIPPPSEQDGQASTIPHDTIPPNSSPDKSPNDRPSEIRVLSSSTDQNNRFPTSLQLRHPSDFVNTSEADLYIIEKLNQLYLLARSGFNGKRKDSKTFVCQHGKVGSSSSETKGCSKKYKSEGWLERHQRRCHPHDDGGDGIQCAQGKGRQSQGMSGVQLARQAKVTSTRKMRPEAEDATMLE